MNAIKLLRRNLKMSLHARVALSDIQQKQFTAQLRGRNAALFAQVHRELDALTPHEKNLRMNGLYQDPHLIARDEIPIDGEWTP